jgi:hypothetical protein
MPKKRVVKSLKKFKKAKVAKHPESFTKKVEDEVVEFEKNIAKEVKIAEKWVIQRRKFLIKLGLLIILIILFLIISFLIQK